MSLAPLELLTGLSSEDSAAVMALGTETHLAGGQVLFDLGSDASNLYVVRRGLIALTLPMDVRGQTQDVLIEERRPGQVVGWSALISPHRFTLKATASVSTDMLTLPRTALADYLDAHPEAGYQLTRNVAAIVGQRLQVFQAMWLRQMQRVVQLTYSA
jgi:CRP/FNR family transcriptional regulator, cyclic AMP receptor protein